MPLHDVGYRNWTGKRTQTWGRWLILAGTSIRLLWRGNWIKRLMVFLFLPSAITLFMFGVYEQSAEDPTLRELSGMILRSQHARYVSATAGVDLREYSQDPAEARHFVWSYFLFTLFRYPQAFGMILVIGLVAPKLISYDLRSRAYLLYLSRPLTPFEYVLGKACVLFFLLVILATIPALLIYLSGLFLSPNPWVVLETWDIPIRVVVATAILALPTSAIALAFSSLTHESRFAGFAWFAFWVIGAATYQSLNAVTRLSEGFDRHPPVYSNWMLFSLYETMGYLQMATFGLTPANSFQWAPWFVVIATTVIGYSITYWRVARMLRA